MFRRFRNRFWLPPRAHGDVVEDRTVSFLELFYDLVYVVVVARAAHTLSEHVSWRTVGEFVVVFGLIWIAWLNGSLYYDLHGREDGRTRVFVFIQMLLLALLAVFTADAAGEGGAPFAIVYATYLTVLTWLWYTVRRQDSDDYRTITGRYLAGNIASIVVIAASATLPDEARLIVWALFVAAWIVGSTLLGRSSPEGLEIGVTATDSTVERFGLFTIIVLGEVVVGVVDGLSDAERSVRSIATGILGLMIGFSMWWTYFDFVGRRLPKTSGSALTQWIFSHLPVTLSIAAIGAAMVSLIEHAADDRAAQPTSWLLAGSVALGLLALIVTMQSLQDYDRLPRLYRPVSVAMVLAAAVALLIGWWRPAPWLLALTLVVVLSAVWVFAVDRWLRLDNPDAALPGRGSS
jgi:low temperature requirement protein LtrA